MQSISCPGLAEVRGLKVLPPHGAWVTETILEHISLEFAKSVASVMHLRRRNKWFLHYHVNCNTSTLSLNSSY